MTRIILVVLTIWLAAGAMAQRPVVIEEFTGTWCGPCYGAGKALDRVIMNYPQGSVIVLAYHLSDAFSTTSGNTRDDYYGISAVPTVIFNGMIFEVGGYSQSAGETGVTTLYGTYGTRIQQEKTRTATSNPFSLRLTGNMGPTNPQMTLTVSTSTGYPRPVTAVFAVTENAIAYAAVNGQTELSGCVRVVLPTRTVNLASPGQTTVSTSYAGTIPYGNASNLHPVVFLQDETTDEILGGMWQFSYAAADDWVLFQ